MHFTAYKSGLNVVQTPKNLVGEIFGFKIFELHPRLYIVLESSKSLKESNLNNGHSKHAYSHVFTHIK